MNVTKLKDKMASKKTMSFEEIVRKDLASNQPGVTMGQAVNALQTFKKNGAELLRFGNTVFIVTDTQSDPVVYHSVNADPPKSYVYNELGFFAKLHEEGKTQAVTYFTSPKTLKFANKYKLPIQTVSESNDPSKGPYMVTTNLTRSA